MRVLALVLVMGCVREPILVKPRHLAAHATTLDSGYIAVEADGDRLVVDPATPVYVRMPGKKRLWGLLEEGDRGMEVPLSTLVAECGQSKCLALQVRDDAVVLGHRKHLDPGGVAQFVAGAVGLGLSITCAVICHFDDGNKATLSALGGAIGLVVMIPPLQTAF